MKNILSIKRKGNGENGVIIFFLDRYKYDRYYRSIATRLGEDGYMIITIPENFSFNATTVLDDNPSKMELLYETNPATNYVAMKLSESAMTKMELSLERKVTETYAETLFTKLTTLGNSLDDAADGASQILDGEVTMQNGVAQINEGTQ